MLCLAGHLQGGTVNLFRDGRHKVKSDSTWWDKSSLSNHGDELEDFFLQTASLIFSILLICLYTGTSSFLNRPCQTVLASCYSISQIIAHQVFRMLRLWLKLLVSHMLLSQVIPCGCGNRTHESVLQFSIT